MSTLAGIAAGMKQRLATVEKGHVAKPLFGGLILVLERRGTTWRLACGRLTAPPSRTEVDLVGVAFGLPAGAEWSWGTKKNSKRRLTYQVAEYTWREVDTPCAPSSS